MSGFTIERVNLSLEFRRGVFFIALGFFVNNFCLAQAQEFPEEKKPLREAWDRGCEVFGKLASEVEKNASPDSKSYFPSLFGRPQFQKTTSPIFHISKESDRRFIATAFVRFEPEPQESADELWKSLDSTFKDPDSYSRWVMPGINESDGWARYFVTLDGLKMSYENLFAEKFMATMPYTFSLLGFERSGISSLYLRRDPEAKNIPSPCLSNRVTNGIAQKIFLRMVPRPELIEFLVGELFYFRTPNAVEAWLHVQARPSPLVFQLMPEMLMRSQIEKRGQRVFQNLVEFRRTARARTDSSSVKQ